MRTKSWLGAVAGCLALLAPGEGALAGQEPSRTMFTQFIWPGGGAIGVLLLAIDVASIALIVQYFLTIRRAHALPEPVRQQVRALFEQRQYRAAIEMTATEPSFLSHVVHAALSEAPHGYAAMERAIEEAVEERTTRLLRKIELLNIIGNIAPMLGLMGTVLGMILAFNAIVAEGGVPNPVVLADAIGIALVTTFWGLVVAVPALAAYSVMRNRIDSLSAEAAMTAQELIGTFRPGADKPEGP